MTLNADDLAKNLAALTERFAGLAAKLIQAAQELQTSGTLPAEALLEELAAARGAFIDLRSSVLDAARPGAAPRGPPRRPPPGTRPRRRSAAGGWRRGAARRRSGPRRRGRGPPRGASRSAPPRRAPSPSAARGAWPWVAPAAATA